MEQNLPREDRREESHGEGREGKAVRFICGLSDNVWRAVNVQNGNLPPACMLDEITQKDVDKQGENLKSEESREPRT